MDMPGTLSREDGGERGGNTGADGGTQATKSSDDDEDLGEVEDGGGGGGGGRGGGEGGYYNFASSQNLQPGGIYLSQRFLRERRGVEHVGIQNLGGIREQVVQIRGLLAGFSTSSRMATPTLITPSNSDTNQIVLSSTPPPSPAGSGPSFSNPTTTIITHSMSSDFSSATVHPLPTATSYVDSGIFPLHNSTGNFSLALRTEGL
jgi:hypothetical protein